MERGKTTGLFGRAAAGFGALFILLMAGMNAGLFLEPVGEALRGEISFEEMTGKIAGGYRSDALWLKDAWVALNGGAARLTGQRLYNDVLLLNNGMLIYGTDPLADTEPTENVEQVRAFSEALGDMDIPYLYVQLPMKADLRQAVYPEGVAYSAGEKADRWVADLMRAGVRVLDLRRLLAGTEADLERNYYRTDQHWNGDGAFLAFGKILEEARALLGDGVDTSVSREPLWQRNVLDHWFLGSFGKRVGELYAGTDALLWRTPRFETEMSCTVEKHKSFYRGTYTEANLREKYLLERDYYRDNAYCVTVGGDYPLVQHRNALAPNPLRVLVLKDSFALPLQCYLSTAFAQVDVIDPRHYTASTLLEYCRWNHPDLVMSVLNVSALGDKRNFAFGEAQGGPETERTVLEAGDVPLEATESPHHYQRLMNLEGGKTYRFSFGKVEAAAGNAEAVSVLVFDFQRTAILRHQIFDVAFSNAGGDKTWTFRVPEGEGEIALLVYAGIHGSTAGNAVIFRDVRVSLLE